LAAANQYPSEYLFDGEAKGMPNLAAIFDNREGTHLLRITVGAAQISCHFFTPDDIELDIDPLQVETHETHIAILRVPGRLCLDWPGLTNRWSGRLIDEVPSLHIDVRAAQLSRYAA
jgi:hypothetical protein